MSSTPHQSSLTPIADTQRTLSRPSSPAPPPSSHDQERDEPVPLDAHNQPSIAAADRDGQIDGAEDEESDIQDDPASRLEAYDWEELQARYQEKMAEVGREEDDILREVDGLVQYFSVWADTRNGHEVERLNSRLATRIAKVQYEEGELEKKQQHHEKVCKAFQSALNLLREL